MMVRVSAFHEVGLLYKGSRYSLDLFKKSDKTLRKRGGVDILGDETLVID